MNVVLVLQVPVTLTSAIGLSHLLTRKAEIERGVDDLLANVGGIVRREPATLNVCTFAPASISDPAMILLPA